MKNKRLIIICVTALVVVLGVRMYLFSPVDKSKGEIIKTIDGKYDIEFRAFRTSEVRSPFFSLLVCLFTNYERDGMIYLIDKRNKKTIYSGRIYDRYANFDILNYSNQIKISVTTNPYAPNASEPWVIKK